jgi:hypothetical protein
MEYLTRKFLSEIGGVRSEAHKQFILRTFTKILDEPQAPPPPLDEEERKLRARKEFIAKMKKNTAGPPFPLQVLAGFERELAQRDVVNANLTAYKLPDRALLIYQLTHCMNPATSGHTRKQMLGDIVRLFDSLGSQDALESMVNRLRVALHNTALHCMERAAWMTKPQSRDIEIRAANASTRMLIELSRFVEQRRGHTFQKFSVNVESGGQAFVVGAPHNGTSQKTGAMK